MINIIITIIVLVLILFIATKLFKTIFKIIGFVIVIIILFTAITGYMVYSDYNTIKDNVNDDEYFVLYDSETEEYLSAFKVVSDLNVNDLIIESSNISGIINDAKNKNLDGLLFVIEKDYLLNQNIPKHIQIEGIDLVEINYNEALEANDDIYSTIVFMSLMKEGIQVHGKEFVTDILKDEVKLYPRLKSVRLFSTIGAI